MHGRWDLSEDCERACPNDCYGVRVLKSRRSFWKWGFGRAERDGYWLASPRAGNITGTDFAIDGGLKTTV